MVRLILFFIGKERIAILVGLFKVGGLPMISIFQGVSLTGLGKQHTAPRTHHTRKFFSRVAHVAAFCVLPLKLSSSRAHAMFRTSIRHFLCTEHSHSSSLLFPQYRTTTCTPATGLLFGRFAEQFLLTLWAVVKQAFFEALFPGHIRVM